MDAVIASGVVAVLALLLLAVNLMMGRKAAGRKPGANGLAQVAGPERNSVAQAWMLALEREGISAELRMAGNGDSEQKPADTAIAYEVWVNTADADRARSLILGERPPPG